MIGLRESDGMFLSIVIATKNRAETLRRALASLFTSENLAHQDWEVIAADNGSTDTTAAVCREHLERFPGHFRFVVENARGKSNALNTGLAAATGNVIALMDDDVVCMPDYLSQVRASCRGGLSEILQGRVYVDYHGRRPGWFDDYFDQVMLSTGVGEERCELRRALWGVNVVLPAEAIEKVGGFCPELGPGSSGYCEDSEFDHRLRKAGYRVIYAPEIALRHQAAQERLDAKYLLTRSFATGRSCAYCDPPPPVPLPRFTAYAVKMLLMALPAALWDVCRGRRARGLRQLCEEATRLGYVTQHWRFRKSGPPVLTIPQVAMLRRQHVATD